MRYLCITCEVLARMTYLCAAHSRNIVDVVLYRRGLHNTPADLRARLQERIDAADAENYDAVLMGYGLCGQATAGLVAGKKPLVIPRAHDCITLFLGSRARYNQQFIDFPGTFWYVQDYQERDDGNSGSFSGAGSDVQATATYEEYVRKYGKDNADYLMEVMGAWRQHYRRAAFIDMGVGDGSAIAKRAQDEANRRGWTYDTIAGDLILIRRLLEGDWTDDYLVVPPGGRVLMTYDSGVIGCARQ